MVNANGRKNETQNIGDEERLEGRQADATSDETLGDLEENQADVGSSSIKSDPGPSPDGALDESEEIKDAGPM